MKSPSLLIAGAIVISNPAHASDSTVSDKSYESFDIVRTFGLKHIPTSDLKAELFRKRTGNTSAVDAIDLNVPFANLHGKPQFMPHQIAPKTITTILRFPDGWFTLTLARVDADGPYICRVQVKKFEPAPNPKEFASYVDWCHASLTLATLDPNGLTAAHLQ